MKLKISELSKHIGKKVKLHMTLEVIRDQKHLQFLIGKDSTGKLQLVSELLVDKSTSFQIRTIQYLILLF